tara:strand:- start:63 stop:491 length:429 start_codon:yes stop_codon:yes gene_type:complete
MEQYFEFVTNHLILVGSWALVFTALAWNFLSNSGRKYNIGPLEACTKINHENAFILDVRSMSEFKDGHIINSENIPMNSLTSSFKALEKYKSTPVIAVCRSGSRSGSACVTLHKNGFEKVFNLKGGIIAWESSNLPIKKGKN